MRETFERAILDNPDDLSAYGAYADWLQGQGDPQGEFMAVQIALEDATKSKEERNALRKREAELLAAHEREWVGDWPDLFPAPTDTEGRGQINHTGGRKYEFKRGLLTTAHFGVLTVAAARSFVKAPQTRLVRELFIGGHPYEEEYEPGPDVPANLIPGDDAPAEHVLLRWPGLRNIRRFQFGWASDEVYGDFCMFQCHLSGDHVFDFVRQMPAVEEVRIFAHFTNPEGLVALPMPNLRVLQLYHGWSFPLDDLAENASLANLTHLLCHPHALEGGDEAYIRLPHLRAVCRSPHLKNLTHLRLRLTDFGDDGVREIIDSGILKRLTILDLRHGAVTDEGASLLAACPDLRNLLWLDLSRNGLTAAGKETIQATGVEVDLAYQHDEIDEDYGDRPRYLYEGDYE